MERSGHRSIEGVRSYKRTSDKQREALSDILSKVGKKARVESCVSAPTLSTTPDPTSLPLVQTPALPATDVSTTTVPAPHSNSQIINTATQHKQQLHGVSFPNATL